MGLISLPKLFQDSRTTRGGQGAPQVVASQLLSSSLGILGAAVTFGFLGAFRNHFLGATPVSGREKSRDNVARLLHMDSS